MGAVFDFYPRGGGELLTALALADHADHQGNNVRPGVAGLARKTRQSERTVQNHLGHMRRDMWLLPVRYLHGGYGRATEYRINPDWLRNPADFAPPATSSNNGTTVQRRAARVQISADKGESDNELRCNYSAPQPSGTVIEPTTTAVSAAPRPGVYDGQTLPEVLQGRWFRSAVGVMAECPGEHREAVLQEVAGIVDRGRLRGSPIGLLHKLVEKAREGTFAPSLGIAYAERERLQRAARERQLEHRSRGAKPPPRPAGDVATTALATMRANLHGTKPG